MASIDHSTKVELLTGGNDLAWKAVPTWGSLLLGFARHSPAADIILIKALEGPGKLNDQEGDPSAYMRVRGRRKSGLIKIERTWKQLSRGTFEELETHDPGCDYVLHFHFEDTKRKRGKHGPRKISNELGIANKKVRYSLVGKPKKKRRKKSRIVIYVIVSRLWERTKVSGTWWSGFIKTLINLVREEGTMAFYTAGKPKSRSVSNSTESKSPP